MSQPASTASSVPSSPSSAEGLAPARTISPAFLETYYNATEDTRYKAWHQVVRILTGDDTNVGHRISQHYSPFR